MTPQQIVGLGVRLLSIWLALSGLHYTATISRLLAFDSFAYFVGLIYIIVALLLWCFPMVVSHRLIPRTRFSNTINLDALEAARVGCCLLGLFLLSQAGPDLVSYAFRMFLYFTNASLYGMLVTYQEIDLLVLIVNVVFALILMFKSGAIANRLMRLPSAPTDEANDREEKQE